MLFAQGVHSLGKPKHSKTSAHPIVVEVEVVVVKVVVEVLVASLNIFFSGMGFLKRLLASTYHSTHP